MAQQIDDSFDFSRRRKTHDFEQYADGMVWQLTKGEDYQTTGTTVQAHARTWAKARGLELSSKILPTTDSKPEAVVLRFTPSTPGEAPF